MFFLSWDQVLMGIRGACVKTEAKGTALPRGQGNPSPNGVEPLSKAHHKPIRETVRKYIHISNLEIKKQRYRG